MADEVILTTDSRPYKSLITDVGNAKMAQAVLEGRKVNIVEMRLGDGGGSYYLPTVEQTALVNEVWSGEIANKSISELSPNIIAVKAVIPSSVGGFTVREAGLFDDDGDLIAVCNMPEIAKATLPDGISSSLDIVMNILLSNTDALEFVINPTLDPASRDDLEQAIAEHNEDPNAHSGIIFIAVAAALQKAIAAGTYYGVLPLTIPADGWVAAEEPSADHNFVCDVVAEGVTSDLIPNGAPIVGSFGIANKAGVVPGCETFDGYVRFYSKSAPTQDINASIILLKQGGENGGDTITQDMLGDGLTVTDDGKLTVAVGNGLSVDEEGRLSVDVSTDDEAGSAIDGVFDGNA